MAIKVHVRWARVSGLEHPEAYVRRMITSEFLSWRRKWSRIIPQAEFREPQPSGHGFAEQHADRVELVPEIARLPSRQRAVLVLRYFEGLGDPAIAELLSALPSPYEPTPPAGSPRSGSRCTGLRRTPAPKEVHMRTEDQLRESFDKLARRSHPPPR